MNDRDLERAAERFADTLYEVIAARVQQALALERDRVDAAFAELRDEVAEVGLRGGGLGEATTDELRLLNDRMTKLTQSVAGLMYDNAGHSVKVEGGRAV